MTGSRPRRKWSAAIATAAVGLALLVAGCGGSSGSPQAGAAGGAGTTASTSAASTPAPAANGSLAGIVQHNGGDQDADNNGGPNDGDGGI